MATVEEAFPGTARAPVNASYVPMLSKPNEVAAVIMDAAAKALLMLGK